MTFHPRNDRVPRLWTRTTAVAMVVLGGLAWVVPSQLVGGNSAIIAPVISIVALVLMIHLSSPWPALRLFLAVMSVTLVGGWFQAKGLDSADSHFLGTSVGLLLMTAIGAGSSGRQLYWATVVFLCAGAVALILGVLGADSATLGRVEALIGIEVTRVPLGIEGLGASGVNANALGAAALLIGPIALAAMLLPSVGGSSVWLARVLGAFCAGAATVALVVSSSRTAWLAAWLTLGILMIRGLHRRVTRGLVGAALLIGPLAGILLVYQIDRSAFLVEMSDLWDSVHSRGRVIQAGVKEVRESPAFGIGLGQFRAAVGPPSSATLSSTAGSRWSTLVVDGNHLVPGQEQIIRLNLRSSNTNPEVAPQDGDWVRLIVRELPDGSVIDSWGTVFDATPQVDGVRTWTFRRGGGVNAGSAPAGHLLPSGSLALNYGGGYQDVAHAHNMFVQTALDLGLFGLFAYIAIVATLVMRGSRLADSAGGYNGNIAAAASIALVAVSVFGLTDCVALGAKIGLFQWFAGGLILGAGRSGGLA